MKRSVLFILIQLCIFNLFCEEMILSLKGSRGDTLKKNTEEIEFLPGSTGFITTNDEYLFIQYSVFGDRRIIKQDWPLKYKDKIKIYNMSYDEDVDIDFYGYNKKTKEWDFAGNCSIKLDNGMNDSDGIVYEMDDPFETVKKAKLKDYTVFCGVSKNDHLYEFKVRASQNDLYVFITKRLDKIQENYKKGAFIIDLYEEGKAASSSIEIKNTTYEAITFVVYGMVDSNQEVWDRIWTIKVKGNSSEELKGPYLGQLADYRFFAITNKEGRLFDYSSTVSGKNLEITVE